MPTNAKDSVYREKEFQMYVLWKSLPAYFRGLKKEQLAEYGFTDPLVVEVTKIKTQTAFAKKYRIKDLGTLTDWNHKIEKNNLRNRFFDSVAKRQITASDKKVALQSTLELENTIEKQRRIIATLKIEIEMYKKRATRRTTLKPVPESFSTKHHDAPVTSNLQISRPIAIPILEPSQPESVVTNKTIGQKIKEFFWKK